MRARTARMAWEWARFRGDARLRVSAAAGRESRIRARFRICGPACFLLLVVFGVPAAWSQSDIGGSVAGQITSISGSPFRALVTLRNTSNGVELETLSDPSGNFRFAEVAPGNYAARVNAP